MPPALPDFVEPMLARVGEPFDSDEHLFELKWDGIRCLSFFEAAGHRLMSRRRRDMTERYPEFEFPRRLPPGLVLDGELVLMRGGRPDFHALMSREHARSPLRIRGLARTDPATYVVFDLLYRDHAARMDLGLLERREELRAVVAECGDPRLVMSEGVVGSGLRFFEESQRIGFEGVVAKRLGSPYLPGRRGDAWTKVKPVHRTHCVILGYLEEAGRLKSLIVGAQVDGELRCVGRVGSGLTEALRARLETLLATRGRPEPVVASEIGGKWVEPDLYCVVSYLEFTGAGNLRAPVFLELITDDE